MLIMMATILSVWLTFLQNEAVVYLFFLAVNPNIRSRGYGSAILQDVKDLAGNRPVVLAN